MREILFRGKPIRGGDWLYGHYTEYKGVAQIWVGTEDEGQWNYLVDLATVGQYTGLTDKNGKKIFEGDILQKLCPVYKLGQSVPVGERMVTGVVYWYDSRSVEPGHWAMGTTDEHGNQSSYIFGNKFEVIGNIHDNPKLMEVDAGEQDA